MESIKLAIPAEAQQGLDSPISGHFGHSSGFVLATISDGKVTEIETIENVPHSSCAGPVELLVKMQDAFRDSDFMLIHMLGYKI